MSRRRVYALTNEVYNPRLANNDTGYSMVSGSGIRFTGDADLGTGWEQTGANAITQVLNDATRIAAKQFQPVFVRASLKRVSGGGLAACYLYYFDAAGSQLSNSQSIWAAASETGEVVVKEGFDTTPASTASVLLTIWQTTDSVVRISNVQVCVDPWGDVPAYCDGDEDDCDWEGTANASRSTGEVTASLPTNYGFNDYTMTDPATIETAPDITLHKQLGADVIRCVGAGAPQTVSGGAIDWHDNTLGDFLDAVREAGLRAAPIVGGPMPWMSSTQLAGLGSGDYDELAEITAALVEEWADILAWVEFSNEPNLGYFWGYPDSALVPDAAKYTAILKLIYPACKAVAPDVPVVAGALSHNQLNQGGGFATKSLSTFLQGMYDAGAEGYMDGISVHPYPSSGLGPPTSAAVNPVGEWYAGVWGAIEQVRAIRDAEGDDVPIYVTEVGTYDSATGRNKRLAERWQGQSNALIRGMLSREGDIEATILHTHFNDPNDGLEIVRPTLTFKPAAELLAA